MSKQKKEKSVKKKSKEKNKKRSNKKSKKRSEERSAKNMKQSSKQIALLLSQVLSRLSFSPSEQRKLKKDVDLFISKLRPCLKKFKADIFVGGSYAKDTQIKQPHKKVDVDIFVRFPLPDYAFKSAQLSDLLEKTLLKKFKLSRLHGSRDYFRVETPQIIFEIIPVLKISSPLQALNITDVSPFHVKWVNQQTTAQLKQEIKLLKRFCQAQRLYGAESYLSGFSGYVLEILVVFYGSFLQVLRAAKKWKPLQVIDIQNYHRQPLLELNQSKLSPLIVVDPVQAGRNAAAALNEETFKQFRKVAFSFLAKPAPGFFYPPPFDPAQLKPRKGQKLVLLTLRLSQGKEDVVGAKLVKAFQFLVSQLKKFDFPLVSADWFWSSQMGEPAFIWFVFNQKELPLDCQKIFIGPALSLASPHHLASFKKKHQQTFVKVINHKKYLCAQVDRSFIQPAPFLKSLFSSHYFRSKIKKVQKMIVKTPFSESELNKRQINKR